MNTTLTQEDIPKQPPQTGSSVFADDPTASKGRPEAPYYQDGVEVRYTAPGNWWNWLWNLFTSWLKNHKADNNVLITEERNLLTAAGIVPDSSNAHQIGQSFHDIAEAYAESYDNATVTVGGVEHPVNRPYVSGVTIMLPDTELL